MADIYLGCSNKEKANDQRKFLCKSTSFITLLLYYGDFITAVLFSIKAIKKNYDFSRKLQDSCCMHIQAGASKNMSLCLLQEPPHELALTLSPQMGVLTGRTGAHLPQVLAGLYMKVGNASQGLKFTGVLWLREKYLMLIKHFTITSGFSFITLWEIHFWREGQPVR